MHDAAKIMLLNECVTVRGRDPINRSEMFYVARERGVVGNASITALEQWVIHRIKTHQCYKKIEVTLCQHVAEQERLLGQAALRLVERIKELFDFLFVPPCSAEKPTS